MWLLRVIKTGAGDMFKSIKKSLGMWGGILLTLVVNSIGIGLLISLVIILLIALSRIGG